MTYSLRPAITSEAKPLIGLYAESGCGKTYSALLLAKGFSGDMSKVAMIETESGRGEVFADDPVVGGYLVRPIRENFSPTEYGKAISDVERASVRVMIIDSASHEWEGNQGVLGMAAENQADGKKGPLVWQKPKMDHQREFMLRLMQTPVPLVIVCMRAKYPMEEVAVGGKKEWQRAKELHPKQSEDILFEMMVHAWIDKEHRLHPTKYTKDAFRSIFIENEPITVDTGRRLAQWAAGGASVQPAGIEERVRACTTREALKALWIEVNSADTPKYKPMFAKRGKEIDGASQPVQQPQGGEAREETGKGKENGSQTGAPEEKVSGVPTIADALDAIERGNYDLASDISRSLPDSERADVEYKLSMRAHA